MYFIIGLTVSAFSIVWSIIHLRQSAVSYFDPVGFAVVIGGTLAVAIITLPWELTSEIADSLKSLFGIKRIDFKQLNRECLELLKRIESGNTAHVLKDKSITSRTLADGIELIELGFTTEKIENILDERVTFWLEHKKKVANSIRSLAKYPPAFGLVGTVLGLVSLMRAISEGASSTETGFRMAVALVATLYGLLIANLVLNPAGENILKAANEEKKSADIALETILLASEKVTLLESQEILNSKVSPRDRVNMLSNYSLENTESADENAA